MKHLFKALLCLLLALTPTFAEAGVGGGAVPSSGTWVPVLAFGCSSVDGTGGTSTNWVYTSQGTVIKNGPFVIATGGITVSAKNASFATGTVCIQGFPYRGAASGSDGFFCSFGLSAMNATTPAVAFWQGGLRSTFTALVLAYLNAGVETFATDVQFTATSYVKFNCAYYTDR